MFNVNGEIWHILFVDPNDYRLMRGDGTYSLAVTDDNEKTIFVACDIPIYKLRHVLIHEITHCFCFSYNLYMDILTEEMICSVVENYARPILRVAKDVFIELDI